MPLGGVKAQLHSFSISTLDGSERANFTPRPIYPREIAPVPISLKAARAPETVWTLLIREKFLDPTRIRTPGRPVRRTFETSYFRKCLS